MEKETTGLYISGHPMTRFAEMIARYECTPIADITSAEERGSGVADGAIVRVAAIVNSRRLKSTRGGEMMAFVQLEDQSGGIEMLVFPKVLAQISTRLGEGSVVMLRGRVSMREEEDAKLIAEAAWAPGEEEPAPGGRYGAGTGAAKGGAEPAQPRPRTKNGGVYLRMESGTAPQMPKVKNLLSIFTPDNPRFTPEKVYFFFKDTGKYNLAPNSLWVLYNPVLERELKRLLGEENVVYKL